METGTIDIFDMSDYAVEATKAICSRMGWTYTPHVDEYGDPVADVEYPAADGAMFDFIFDVFK